MKKYMTFAFLLLILIIPLVLVFTIGQGNTSGDPISYSDWTAGTASSECAQVGNYSDSAKLKNISLGASKSSNGNTITIGNVSFEEGEPKSFAFSSSGDIGAVIVHAGEGANVWFYNPQVNSDSGLYGFQNNSISEITFCWNSLPAQEITSTAANTPIDIPTDTPEDEITSTPTSTATITETLPPESTEEKEEEPVISETPEPTMTNTPEPSPTEDVSESDDITPTDEEPIQEASIQLIKEVVSINDDPSVTKFNQPGDKITYSFTITNTGNVDLTDVVISDPYAAVSGDPIVFMAPSDSDTTNFFATHIITQADIDADLFTNTASVVGLSPSGDPVSDEASVSVEGSLEEASIQLNMEITAVNGDSSIKKFSKAGDEISYSLTIINTGNLHLTDVSISDSLAAVAGDTITDLAPGASDSTTLSATYTITQDDLDGEYFTNEAIVNGESPSGSIVSDEATVTVKRESRRLH